MMKKYTFNEIYYASTEKSASSGFSGFGVRTYTRGMSSDEVDMIMNSGINVYVVNSEKRLTFEQIQSNPKIVYDYPVTYIYTKIDINGFTKYVIARMVYIAVDYGYFCGGDALRTGANYFSHYMVFDERPPFSIFKYLEAQTLFVPHDYTCSPNNEELKLLLCGEPPVLSPGSIELPEDCSDLAVTLDTDAANCIIAYLQAYFNKINNKDANLQKIIILTPEERIPHLIKMMTIIPSKLSDVINFTTNYMSGYGVPDNYNIVFVNQYNTAELYKNNYVCVDLFTNTTKNIDNNFFYKKIIELSNEGDIETIIKLISFYLELDLTKDLNYNFLYNLFIAVESSKELQIDDVSEDFVRHLDSTHLTTSQKSSLWEKINQTINQSLKSTHGAEINKAINAVGYILVNNRQYLNLSPECRTWITDVIFEKSYLGKIVNTQNIDSIIYILNRGSISSETMLYKALNQTNDIEIWYKLLHYYYGTSLKTNTEPVVESVLQSSLKKNVKDELVNKLYPVDKCKNELLSYLLKNTKRIPELIEVVKQICLGSHEERFSLMIQHSNNDPSVIKALSPIVVSYYDSIINREPNVGMKELLDFVDKISVEVINMMEICQLFATYTDMCMQNPTKKAQTSLSRILKVGLKLDRETSEKIETLNGLFENEVPKKVDLSILHIAHKMNKDTDYIRDLYEIWLKSQPTYKELKEYVKNVEFMSSDIIEELILSTWNSRTRAIRENREEYVLAIVDNVDWKGRDKKAFIKSCRDKTLIVHLTESDKIMKKLFRKILNLLK